MFTPKQTKEELKKSFKEAYNYVSEHFRFLHADEQEEKFMQIAGHMYDIVPNMIKVELFDPGIQRFKIVDHKSEYLDDAIKKKIEDYNGIIENNSYLNLKNKFDELGIPYLEHRLWSHYILVTEEFFLYFKNPSLLIYIGKETEVPEYLKEFMEPMPTLDKRSSYQYVVFSPNGFQTRNLFINKLETDINLNYNDDMPHEKIKEALDSDKAGVIILHGVPGTGKSSYIRHLISTINKNFIYFDQSCFQHLTSSSMINLLMENRNAVIILEDAEELIKKRKNGNAQISALLNLTDGLLADSLKFKFICTFNADIGDIDPALLRKGRLKVKYDIKPLTPDKVKKLADAKGLHVGDNPKSMTLGDVYNIEDKVDFDAKKRKTVGFDN